MSLRRCLYLLWFAHSSGTLKGFSGAIIILVPSLRVIDIFKGKEKNLKEKINMGLLWEILFIQVHGKG